MLMVPRYELVLLAWLHLIVQILPNRVIQSLRLATSKSSLCFR